MLQADRHIFNRSLETWEKSPTMSMKQWIRSNRPFIKYCLIEALKQQAIHSSDIRTFIPNFKPKLRPTHRNSTNQRRGQSRRDKNRMQARGQQDIRTTNGWALIARKSTIGGKNRNQQNNIRRITEVTAVENTTETKINVTEQTKITDHFNLHNQTRRETTTEKNGHKPQRNHDPGENGRESLSPPKNNN